MPTQRYSVTQPPIETIFTWIKSGEVAIPEIQRPFVWEATKVRNLLDSLAKGFPVGYLIAWRNPDVKLKDGTSSHGKRILIDGQQRVTALMASLLGREVLTEDYERVRVRIAFHPGTRQFEVHNPAIAKDVACASRRRASCRSCLRGRYGWHHEQYMGNHGWPTLFARRHATILTIAIRRSASWLMR